MIYPKIISRIKDSSSIAILSHVMPDGDNIGASLGLYNALQRVGKNVRYILDDEVPKLFRFLKNADKVEKPGEYEAFDTVIVLDCGDPKLLGKCNQYLRDNFIINIDHHISNTAYGNLNMVDANAAAVGEMIYQIVKIMGIPMDQEISECLYTSIVTDTGQFQYSNTTSVTHQIAGDLINNGVSTSLMFERIYQNNSKEKVLLMKLALETLEFYHGDKISCIAMDRKKMDSSGAKPEDSDGLINLARDVECVEAAVFLKEIEPGKVKVGFRSKRFVDVCRVAKQFGGGGHVRAAGCTVAGSIAEVKPMILDAVIKEYQQGVDSI